MTNPNQETAKTWQSKRNTEARADFIRSNAMLTGRQVTALIASASKPSGPSMALATGPCRPFSVRYQGRMLYPAFQFDTDNARLYPEVDILISTLSRDYGLGWQFAFWFVTPNAWLDRRTPLSIWPLDRGQVVEAARAESKAFHE